MRLLLALLSVFFLTGTLQAQELNATVTVNAQNVAQPNQPIFKTLETSLQDFMNNTKWTEVEFAEEERINCSLTFIVDSYLNDQFSGNFQLSVSRPVYNSSYSTSVFNFKDDDIAFSYVEYAPFFYNDNQYENNLISIITYYVYVFLGMDAASFELNGGDQYFREAQQIANLAQGNSRAPGWSPNDGLISRFRLTDDLMLDTYAEFHEVMYKYHREGMDKFAEDPKQAKQTIIDAVSLFKDMNDRRPNSFLLRSFFDAKADELKNIFSGGPAVNTADFKSTLQRLSPTNASKWREIKV